VTSGHVVDPFGFAGRWPFGVQIVESILAVERRQVRFPRTKKRRIQQKWRKDERNWFSKPCAYLVADLGLVCHPLIAERLRRMARQEAS